MTTTCEVLLDEGLLTRLPSPLLKFEAEQVDKWADEAVTKLMQAGPDAGAETIFRIVQSVAESQYGSVVSRRLSRLQPLIHRLVHGTAMKSSVVGKGGRFLTAWIQDLLPDEPFHEVSDHPWTCDLENSVGVIVGELKTRRGTELWVEANKEAFREMGAPEWRSLGLVKMGLWVASDAFSKTKALLLSLPIFIYEACISVMPPHTKICPHSDNVNFTLTAHMGLELEEGLSTIYVGEYAQNWSEGEVFIFDQSYIHSAENNSDRKRTVLFLRFYHPDLTEEECYSLLFLTMFMLAYDNKKRERMVSESGLEKGDIHNIGNLPIFGEIIR